MAQVFISYAHVSPDQDFAAKLREILELNGFDVFVDTKIEIGQNWVEQIDVQLRKSTHFVVLLSQSSIKSDMVRREIAIAYRLNKAKQLAILPVRLALTDELPYDLSAYLDLIQYTTWRAGEPFDQVCETIIRGIRVSAPGDGNVTQLVYPKRFAETELESLTANLARHLGPMARLVVTDAAKKAVNWDELCEILAAEIPAGTERKSFEASCKRWG